MIVSITSTVRFAETFISTSNDSIENSYGPVGVVAYAVAGLALVQSNNMRSTVASAAAILRYCEILFIVLEFYRGRFALVCAVKLEVLALFESHTLCDDIRGEYVDLRVEFLDRTVIVAARRSDLRLDRLELVL